MNRTRTAATLLAAGALVALTGCDPKPIMHTETRRVNVVTTCDNTTKFVPGGFLVWGKALMSGVRVGTDVTVTQDDLGIWGRGTSFQVIAPGFPDSEQLPANQIDVWAPKESNGKCTPYLRRWITVQFDVLGPKLPGNGGGSW